MPINLTAVATCVRRRLYQGQPTTSVSTLYTVPAATDVKVTQILLCNVTATAATITISEVPSGGTAGVTNRIVNAMTVVPGEPVVVTLSSFLATGDFLAALQGTASAITMTISGETYS